MKSSISYYSKLSKSRSKLQAKNQKPVLDALYKETGVAAAGK
jgi:hypothetical protein